MKKIYNSLFFGLIVLSVVLFLFAPISRQYMAYETVENKTHIKVDEESSITIQKAWDRSFTLAKGQKLIIEFKCNYENSSATLKILGKGLYESMYSLNTTIPDNIQGKTFFVSTPNVNVDPAGINDNGMNAVTAQYDDFWYIEFMGDGNTAMNPDSIWSEPGDYVVIVYGQNPSPQVDDTKFYFDIKMKIDVYGKQIQLAMNIIGGMALLIAVVIGSYILINKMKGGQNP